MTIGPYGKCNSFIIVKKTTVIDFLTGFALEGSTSQFCLFSFVYTEKGSLLLSRKAYEMHAVSILRPMCLDVSG